MLVVSSASLFGQQATSPLTLIEAQAAAQRVSPELRAAREAIVILCGLLSATALNMLVLPALYWLYGERVVVEVDAIELQAVEPRVGMQPVPSPAH